LSRQGRQERQEVQKQIDYRKGTVRRIFVYQKVFRPTVSRIFLFLGVLGGLGG